MPEDVRFNMFGWNDGKWRPCLARVRGPKVSLFVCPEDLRIRREPRHHRPLQQDKGENRIWRERHIGRFPGPGVKAQRPCSVGGAFLVQESRGLAAEFHDAASPPTDGGGFQGKEVPLGIHQPGKRQPQVSRATLGASRAYGQAAALHSRAERDTRCSLRRYRDHARLKALSKSSGTGIERVHEPNKQGGARRDYHGRDCCTAPQCVRPDYNPGSSAGSKHHGSNCAAAG